MQLLRVELLREQPSHCTPAEGIWLASRSWSLPCTGEDCTIQQTANAACDSHLHTQSSHTWPECERTEGGRVAGGRVTCADILYEQVV